MTGNRHRGCRYIGGKLKKKKTALLSVGMISLGLLVGQVVPATAAPDSSKRDEALTAIAAVSPTYKSAAKPVKPHSVPVPPDSSGSIKITGDAGQSLSIGLPFAEKAVPATPIGDGLVEYDNANGSVSVPVPQVDNSIAIHTVLESKDAPSRYEYEIKMPAGASLQPDGEGSVYIQSRDGSYLGGFAKPWATDAAGVSLPTSYEIEGSALVQTVDHSGADVQYPVVADPWMGIDLIDGHPWITYTSKGGVANLVPTLWGRQKSGAIYHTAHVDELRTKLNNVGWNLTGTIQEQYLCHVVGNVFEWGTYNLESWRPYMSWWNQLNLQYQCNPT